MNDTAFEFAKMYDDVHRVNQRLATLRPHRLVLTTMTMCGTLSNFEERIPLAELVHNLDDQYGIRESNKKSKTGKKDFQNQIGLKSGSVNIKVFSNGSVHGTGLKSAVHFVDIVDRVCATLGEFMADCPQLDVVSVECINATFFTSKVLPLARLREIFRQHGYESTYNPDIFSAVQVKIPVNARFIKIHIFSTGRVNISAGKHPSDIFQAYSVVCSVLDGVDGLLDTRLPVTNVSESILNTYSIIDGYSNRIYYLCKHEHQTCEIFSV
jgi:TATA-box binding protein (TBP) (component of TFIID and TFIIIB)